MRDFGVGGSVLLLGRSPLIMVTSLCSGLLESSSGVGDNADTSIRCKRGGIEFYFSRLLDNTRLRKRCSSG